ncbi:MAG: hypothetical protein AAF610_08770 [Pseudomonadota bacterium]
MANSADIVSIGRRVRAFVRAQRRNPSRYRVLAEGDSWFTTPVESWKGPTLIGALKRQTQARRRVFNIVSVANPGTELLPTLHPNNHDFALATLPDWRREQTYDLVLLSSGGNDVLGSRLSSWLRDPMADSAVGRALDRARTDEARARCLLDCSAYVTLLEEMLGRLASLRRDVLTPNGLSKARVLIHGYDYPVPDGRPMRVLGGAISIGPWLKPAFKRANVPDELRPAVIKLLIDEYNARLRELALGQRRFHYLDLRGTLRGPDDWADEIHPHRSSGIAAIAQRMGTAMRRIRDGGAPSIMGPRAPAGEYRC